MWNFASKALAGSIAPKIKSSKSTHTNHECSDDEACSCTSSKDEGLECPICWEYFNIVENVPYVLWCGHTLCKNCVMGLQWAAVNIPNLPLQLPLFISCPWCQLLSFRLVYNGILKFPRKNYFLLWMVESLNRDQEATSCACISSCEYRKQRSLREHMHMDCSDNSIDQLSTGASSWVSERIFSAVKKSIAFIFQLTSKFPLVVIFLLILVYIVPASAVILALYVLVTLLLAMPSFLMLYFAYPTLDWLAREIFA